MTASKSRSCGCRIRLCKRAGGGSSGQARTFWTLVDLNRADKKSGWTPGILELNRVVRCRAMGAEWAIRCSISPGLMDQANVDIEPKYSGRRTPGKAILDKHQKLLKRIYDEMCRRGYWSSFRNNQSGSSVSFHKCPSTAAQWKAEYLALAKIEQLLKGFLGADGE